ncbi:hypothetical protein QP162_06715 [Sphingomonas aurantiaca]|uniref:hypothetical protein n=1 Tax=Sphingomonas aurantiaca TaxID=185949 RepID=UPI002FE01334
MFPGAELRRLQMPRKPGTPVVLRLRQSFEWTPNGRTFVYADPATLTILAHDDPATRETRHRSAKNSIPCTLPKLAALHGNSP